MIIYKMNDENNVPSLKYASIKDSTTTSDKKNSYFTYYMALLGDNEKYTLGQGNQDKTDVINKILDKTIIKKACCRQNQIAQVKVPIPKDILDITDTSSRDYWHADKYSMYSEYDKYKYFNMTTKVPISLCPDDYKVPGKACDNFFAIYCMNTLKAHKDANSGRYNHAEYSKYSPECVCYGDPFAFQDPSGSFKGNFPGKCVYAGCATSTSAYKDPLSRTDKCSMTICNAVASAADASVGGDIKMKASITQNCGNSMPPADKARMEKERADAKANADKLAAEKKAADAASALKKGVDAAAAAAATKKAADDKAAAAKASAAAAVKAKADAAAAELEAAKKAAALKEAKASGDAAAIAKAEADKKAADEAKKTAEDNAKNKKTSADTDKTDALAADKAAKDTANEASVAKEEAKEATTQAVAEAAGDNTMLFAGAGGVICLCCCLILIGIIVASK
jgi:hypothetical protein